MRVCTSPCWGCLSCCCDKMLWQKQLGEKNFSWLTVPERYCLSWWSRQGKQRSLVAEAGGSWSHYATLRTQRSNTKWGQAIHPLLHVPSTRDSFLVVRLPVLKVPQPFYIALPVRDQQVKYMSLWETFHTQNTMGE